MTEDFKSVYKRGFAMGKEEEQKRITQVLEDHVWQIDVKYKIFGFKWKQRCRCGSYGVFNEHLLNMIGAQNNE